MKTLAIIALALVATAWTFEIEDIPGFMKERLDKYVALTEKWEKKWNTMSEDDREFFEQMIYDRLSHIPESVKRRIHKRVEGMEAEDQEKLRIYLEKRFPEIQVSETSTSDDQKISEIIEKLPEVLREKISDFISIRFAPATAYENTDDVDFIDFPDIPELIELPEQSEGVPYSEDGLEGESLAEVDEFLLQREDWKRRWENLPDEKRETFEKYIKAKMNV